MQGTHLQLFSLRKLGRGLTEYSGLGSCLSITVGHETRVKEKFFKLTYFYNPVALAYYFFHRLLVIWATKCYGLNCIPGIHADCIWRLDL